jgi:hypothetical protein
MSPPVPQRRPSARAPSSLQGGPKTARERVLRALELGRRGQLLWELGEHDRPGDLTRPR